jgi:hypothetical protein
MAPVLVIFDDHHFGTQIPSGAIHPINLNCNGLQRFFSRLSSAKGARHAQGRNVSRPSMRPIDGLRVAQSPGTTSVIDDSLTRIETDIALIRETMATKNWVLSSVVAQTFAILGGVAELLELLH